MHTKSLQWCLTLCNPMDCSLSGSSVHGILQASILEWVAMPSSRGSFRPRDQILISMSPALAGGFFTISATWDDVQNSGKNCYWLIINIKNTIQEHLNARDAQGKGKWGVGEMGVWAEEAWSVHALPCPLQAPFSAPRCVHQPTWSVLKGLWRFHYVGTIESQVTSQSAPLLWSSGGQRS